jgi:hypothetical protein
MFESEAAYWNARYANGGNSGAGSYGEAVQQKVAWLAELPDVKSIVEIGCGDFNFGSLLVETFEDATYQGFDTSDFIVSRNSRIHASPRVKFLWTGGPWFAGFTKSDLLLCVDVLFHIESDDLYEETLNYIDVSWTKYLAISAYEYDGIRQGHVHIRKFDPARFGVPILRETIEADGDMKFYVWKR